MKARLPSQLLLSSREYDILADFVKSNTDDSYQSKKQARREKTPAPTSATEHEPNAAAFRAASRVYVGTTVTLKGLDALIRRIRARRTGKPAATVAGLSLQRHRLALSIASLLFFHRVLYRIFHRMRLQLLHEKVRDIRQRYPRLYAALTSRIAPAIGASLSGLALGIYPASQLRVTITIYALVRSLELIYKAADASGYLANKPRWMGSWLILAASQAQLLHAFVFDRECFPEFYGTFILNNTHEYIQQAPATMSKKVTWPTTQQMVTSLQEMARLNWPPFISPILHPTRTDTLPASIDPVISPVTSGAHPAIQHLSCALLHPNDTSCFIPYLRQILSAFPSVARFFTLYYGALSLLRIKSFLNTPGPFLNNLAKQILQTTIFVSGSISTAWASICLFSNIFPRTFLPGGRFVLGGFLGGSWAIFDQGKVGQSNAMYTLRTSLDSLWKVGVKKRWWKGIKGGDIWIVCASLIVFNWARDLHERGRLKEKNAAFSLVKLLRGEIEVGLGDEVSAVVKKENKEQKDK